MSADETREAEWPLDERMLQALIETGLDEGEAIDAIAAVLPMFADDLRAVAAEFEWVFRSVTFRRGGCASETRLHPSGMALRARADSLFPAAQSPSGGDA